MQVAEGLGYPLSPIPDHFLHWCCMLDVSIPQIAESPQLVLLLGNDLSLHKPHPLSAQVRHVL